MPKYKLTVNSSIQSVEAEPGMPLLWVLRDLLNLTGTKFGCGVGLCGACTIHLDDEAVRSCMIPISAVGSKAITTIEGLSSAGSQPVQQAWLAESVSQCGYCQPGMIMTAVVLLKKTPNPTDTDIDSAYSDHLCRCGTYLRIRKALHRAAGGG
jgi:isoquinoline 1-oxidoreductase alpha subunit